MNQARILSTVLALGTLAALPACSMFGGGDHQYRQSAAPAAAAPAAPAQQAQENNSATQAVSPQMIRQVQTALRQDHLYHGRVDGTWGPMTQHAVLSYQKQHNLNTTGQIDGPTLQAMNLQNQYGEGNGGSNGSMANGGSNMGPNGSTNANGGNTNYSTGSQNPPGMNAGNMPAPDNSGSNPPATNDGMNTQTDTGNGATNQPMPAPNSNGGNATH